MLKQGVLLSLHLKATMMRVSDPIIFCMVVHEFYKKVLIRYDDELKALGFDANNSTVDLYDKINKLPANKQEKITQSIEALYAE